MIIADAIATASSEHEVYFLLTAYLEAVRYGDRHGLLPDELTRLPVTGHADVEDRLHHLGTEPAPPAPSSERARTLIREARNVMGTAHERLMLLPLLPPRADD